MSDNTQISGVSPNGHSEAPMISIVQKMPPALAPSLRVEAGAKAPKPAGRGEGNINDALARPRDEEGLPKTRPLVYLSPGLLGGRPLAETSIGQLLEKVADKFPARAEKLGVLYEEGLRFNKQQFDDLDRLEREQKEADNAEIERRNAGVETWQAALEEERDQKCADDRKSVVTLDQPLAQAHGEAAQAVARTGSDYDPNNPISETVLRERPLSLEVVKGRNSLPWTSSDDVKRVPEWLQMLFKLGVGLAIGLSIGFISHMISPDNLGDKMAELIGCLFLGFVVAAGSGWAVRGLARRASERYWLARFGNYGPLFWIPSLLLMAFVMMVSIGFEATVETLGLLAPAKLEEQNGGGAALPAMVFVLVGLIFTVGYLVTQACEGSLDGRHDVIINRAKALQHEEFTPREQAERQNERVQAALEKLSLVRELKRQVAYLEARIEQTVQPFNAKIGALESFKQVPQSGLSDAACQRMRDVFDNWAGPNSDWHEALDALLDEIEPLQTKRRAPSMETEAKAPPQIQPQSQPGLLTRFKNWWQGRGQ